MNMFQSIFMKAIYLTIFFTVTATALEDSDSILQIVDSGSSNTAGYTIQLQQNGTVTWTIRHRSHAMIFTTATGPTITSTQMNIQFLPVLVENVFENVRRALPFNQYPTRFCIKSVSFGTSLNIFYQEQQSPDLNCPLEDSRLISLNKAAREIISVLHINTLV